MQKIASDHGHNSKEYYVKDIRVKIIRLLVHCSIQSQDKDTRKQLRKWTMQSDISGQGMYATISQRCYSKNCKVKQTLVYNLQTKIPDKTKK